MQAQTLRALIRLARLDKPAGAWLALAPALWEIAMVAPCLCPQTLWVAALFTVGAFAVRGAGCAINDVWDRHIDAKVARTASRPVAAGEVSVPVALGFAAVLAAAGAAVLLQFNALTIAIGLAAVPLIALYPLAKRVILWPQVVLALTFNLGALMGWAAVAGSLAAPSFAIYAAAALWTLGYDTVYAFQDAADDARAGVGSSALALGPHRARPFVAGCYALALALLAWVVHAAGGQALWLAPAAAHMAWQVWAWRPGDPGSAARIFASNPTAGMLVLLGVIYGKILIIF